jgi:hemoglobin-like flavoprotein
MTASSFPLSCLIITLIYYALRGSNLGQNLHEIVHSVENPSLIRERMRELAPIHLARGVKGEHAMRIGKALFWTIEHVLASDHNAEVCNYLQLKASIART